MRSLLLIAGVGAGWLLSGVLVAMLIGPQMRRSASGLSSELRPVPVPVRFRGVVRSPRVAPVPIVTPWRRPGRWTVSAGFAAAAFAGSTGLAAAGALPQPVQEVAHSVFRSVGVSVPQVSGREAVSTASPTPPPSPGGGSVVATDDFRPDRARRASAREVSGVTPASETTSTTVATGTTVVTTTTSTTMLVASEPPTTVPSGVPTSSVPGDSGSPLPAPPVAEPVSPPVDPAPVDPTPVDPTPVDPTPVDPTPVDPPPVDPPPVDLPPVDPEPSTRPQSLGDGPDDRNAPVASTPGRRPKG